MFSKQIYPFFLKENYDKKKKASSHVQSTCDETSL